MVPFLLNFKVESFCSTYNPDVYVVVYSVVDRRSLKFAEETLLHLWKSDYMASHGVILVGNKVDLERKREVPAMSKFHYKLFLLDIFDLASFIIITMCNSNHAIAKNASMYI